MKISIIIPVFNEEETIQATINHVQNVSRGYIHEIIVVDGGSTDDTVLRAREANATVVSSSHRGRARQMNYGASHAEGTVLYFLHADSLPPQNFDAEIKKQIANNTDAGCFRLRFDDDHPLLRFYGWCTRFDLNAFRFGDQSLFITQKAFSTIGGFREDHIVMEDNEIVRRIKKGHSFSIVAKEITTSARKYRENGIIKLQLVFMLIYSLYFLNIPQQKLRKIYTGFLN